jgi:hypothetical protein
VLLDGINHVAWISKDIARLGRFYAEVFDAEVGPTRPHGQEPGETMTVIRIGPHTELNIFVIEGNTEPDRQTPTGSVQPSRPACDGPTRDTGSHEVSGSGARPRKRRVERSGRAPTERVRS